MAYVDQSVIDDVRAELKALNKKYGMKATASGKGTSSLTITISSGPLDFLSQIKGYYAGMQFLGQSYSVQDWQELRGCAFNHYHDEDKYTGKEQEYLKIIEDTKNKLKKLQNKKKKYGKSRRKRKNH